MDEESRLCIEVSEENNSACHSSGLMSHKRLAVTFVLVLLLGTVILTHYTYFSGVSPYRVQHSLVSDVSSATLRGFASGGNTSDDGIEIDVERHAQHTQRRLPQCIIIGLRKGGTRALLEFLNLHSSIVAKKPEMHFFDDDENYQRGLDWYRKKMPYSFKQQLTIEKTPGYFIDELVPQRIYSMNKSIKLLVVVRDPVERAISDYTQIQSVRYDKNKDYPPFEELAINPATGEVNQSYQAVYRSLYVVHLMRWLQFFKLEQFHFVSGEELVKNPVAELRKVEDFLGLKHELNETYFYFNETRGFYCMHLEHRDKCLAPSKGREHDEVPKDVIAKLRAFFKPYNEQFYKVTGIDFKWIIK